MEVSICCFIGHEHGGRRCRSSLLSVFLAVEVVCRNVPVVCVGQERHHVDHDAPFLSLLPNMTAALLLLKHNC